MKAFQTKMAHTHMFLLSAVIFLSLLYAAILLHFLKSLKVQ